MKKNKWSQSDDNILIECVQENPQNLLKAFNAASEQLNRSKAAVRLRWYNVLKNNNKAFMLISNNTSCYNTKTTVTNVAKDIPVKASKWKRIIKILFE